MHKINISKYYDLCTLKIINMRKTGNKEWPKVVNLSIQDNFSKKNLKFVLVLL